MITSIQHIVKQELKRLLFSLIALYNLFDTSLIPASFSRKGSGKEEERGRLTSKNK
jgi:hypothetical protein